MARNDDTLWVRLFQKSTALNASARRTLRATVLAIVALTLAASPSWAQTPAANLVPNADRTITNATPFGSCTSANYSLCVADAVPALVNTNSGITTSSSGASSLGFDLTNASASGLSGTTTSLVLRAAATCSAGTGGSISVSIRNSSDVVVAGPFSLAVSGGNPQILSSASTVVSFTTSVVDGLRYHVESSPCSAGGAPRIFGLSLATQQLRTTTVSGSALESDGTTPWSKCDGVTPNISLASSSNNGTPSYYANTVPCDALTGYYESGLKLNHRHERVHIYLDDNAPGEYGAAVLRTQSSSGVLSAIDIVAGSVRAHTIGTDELTSDQIGAWSATQDPDVGWTYSSSTLNTGIEYDYFVVAAGTFEHSRLTTRAVRVLSGATLSYVSSTATALTITNDGLHSASAVSFPSYNNATVTITGNLQAPAYEQSQGSLSVSGDTQITGTLSLGSGSANHSTFTGSVTAGSVIQENGSFVVFGTTTLSGNLQFGTYHNASAEFHQSLVANNIDFTNGTFRAHSTVDAANLIEFADGSSATTVYLHDAVTATTFNAERGSLTMYSSLDTTGDINLGTSINNLTFAIDGVVTGNNLRFRYGSFTFNAAVQLAGTTVIGNSAYSNASGSFESTLTTTSYSQNGGTVALKTPFTSASSLTLEDDANFTIEGELITDSLTHRRGSIAVQGDATVTSGAGSITLGGSVYSTAVTIQGDVHTNSLLANYASITVNEDIVADTMTMTRGSITVTGDTTITGDLIVGQSGNRITANFGTSVSASTYTQSAGTLNASGPVTIDGLMRFPNTGYQEDTVITLQDGLHVGAFTHRMGSLDVVGDMTVDGLMDSSTTSSSNRVNINIVGSLTANQIIQVSQTLAVTNNLDVVDSIVVGTNSYSNQGYLTVGGNLSATSLSNPYGSVTVNGDLFVSGAINQATSGSSGDTSLEVLGDLTAGTIDANRGPVTIHGSAQVAGQASFGLAGYGDQSTVTVHGAWESGNLATGLALITFHQDAVLSTGTNAVVLGGSSSSDKTTLVVHGNTRAADLTAQSSEGTYYGDLMVNGPAAFGTSSDNPNNVYGDFASTTLNLRRGTLSIGRNFSISDAITSNSAATLRFTYGGTSHISYGGQSSISLNRLTLTGSAGGYKRVVFPAGTSTVVTTSISVTGVSCDESDGITMLSSAPGAAYSINSPITRTYSYVHVSDMTELRSGGSSFSNSANGGNNTNVTFGSSEPCNAPSDLLVGKGSPAVTGGGSANPIDISGAANDFYVGTRNRVLTGRNRQNVQVTTSPLDYRVNGLWRFNGDGTDSARTSAVTIENASFTSARSADFGGATGALTIGASDAVAYTPRSQVHRMPEFTVSGWFKTSDISQHARATLVRMARSDTDRNYEIWFDRDAHQLRAGVSAGGSEFVLDTNAEPWLDDEWHHVTFVARADKTLELYVDGISYADGSYSGTIDQPFTHLSFGNAVSFSGDTLSQPLMGQLDDWQLRAEPLSKDEIEGFVATERPHAFSLLDTGEVTISSCNSGVYCVGTMYTGPSLVPTSAAVHLQSARYWSSARLRQNTGDWTRRSEADWFEVSTPESLTVTSGDTATFPASAPGQDVTTTVELATNCSVVCSLYLNAPSQTIALAGEDTEASIGHFPERDTPIVWPVGEQDGMGVTVLTAAGKDQGRWGSGTDFSDLLEHKFIGLSKNPVNITTLPSGTSNADIGLRLNAPHTADFGTYTGRVVLTVIPGS